MRIIRHNIQNILKKTVGVWSLLWDLEFWSVRRLYFMEWSIFLHWSRKTEQQALKFFTPLEILTAIESIQLLTRWRWRNMILGLWTKTIVLWKCIHIKHGLTYLKVAHIMMPKLPHDDTSYRRISLLFFIDLLHQTKKKYCTAATYDVSQLFDQVRV